MLLRLSLAVLAACGRIGFEPMVDPDGELGHDEDGDGVADGLDVCPHLVGSQLDRDGDRVGDDCDPEPDLPRQSLVLFATMTPQDQPFQLEADGVWTAGPDAITLDGTFGKIVHDVTVQSGTVAFGFDVMAVLGGSVQHQVALHVSEPGAPPPGYSVEFNEVDIISRAAITVFDGAMYAPLVSQDLPQRMHTGAMTLQSTVVAGATPMTTLDGGWAGEPYHLEMSTPGYTGGSAIEISINNLTIAVRYAWVIATL